MKKVFIGVLAALMLFAFTACDNSTPSNPYATIAGVGVRTSGDSVYLEGEDFDFRGVELVLYMTDGKEVAADPASFVVAADGKKLETSDTSVTVSYLGLADYDAAVPVTVKAINAITVNATNLVTQYVGKGGSTGSDTFDAEGLVVTGQYKDGDTVVLERTLAEDDYRVNGYTSPADGKELTLTVSKGTAQSEAFKVTPVKDTVASYTLTPSKSHYYVGDSKALADNFTLDLEWESGEETEDAAIAEYLVWDATAISDNSSKFVADDIGTWTLTTYLDEKESVSIPATLTVDDSISSIDVSKKDMKVQPGDSIDGSFFNVTVKMASDPDAENGTPITAGIKVGTTNNGPWKDSIEVSHVTTDKEITVYVAAEINGKTVACPTQFKVTVDKGTN